MTFNRNGLGAACLGCGFVGAWPVYNVTCLGRGLPSLRSKPGFVMVPKPKSNFSIGIVAEIYFSETDFFFQRINFFFHVFHFLGGFKFL